MGVFLGWPLDAATQAALAVLDAPFPLEFGAIDLLRTEPAGCARLGSWALA